MCAVIEAKLLQSKNTVALARGLLGRVLVTAGSEGVLHRARICEVEAYQGEEDLACHASKGRTTRTDVMYRAGGVWYVYLCYGVHEMLNLVTGPEGRPSAILIRGVEGATGPGRLTRLLGIDRRFNARPALPTAGLWIEDDGFRLKRGAILSGPRIGVDYAGPVWAAKPWRFYYLPPKLTRAAGNR
ncbi:MAG: DNA-3-methyladenine glycosylase [Rariglobus sp.]|nr:DNA-3-methyladenine glycosylase [Rariglobus sp.]